MNRFHNKTVLITGAAGGMGASHARGFLGEGADVVVTDIREDRGRILVKELGERAHFIRLDVTEEADWAAAVQETESRFGPVSVLVNNAGVLSPSALIEDGDLADWQHVIDVNLTGTYLGIRAVVPSLRRAGGGAIVNIASTSGHVGTALISPYVASKWGVRGLTRTAAIELGRDGIRVNSINPGVVNTPLITEPLHPGAAPVSDYYSPEPFAIKRLADPQDITNLLLFLASDEASFVTGSEYVADGGLLLGPALADGQTQNRS
ncbi:glucose 1-dehydrogenase [Streptomyces sp. NBC_00365]|uniref:SDR family NAD(P)-dependent oxidoreductase n=1 Tax=Streptomyces sp. NBC_00365 TaxID=2975726 RepID=UPI002257EF6D|nr:glucose 1-dehydrogenase [Streptomyces sp. NBC_00365]MCX5097140.1 glucose 1-dehydrogenase [Streptomyces sp. NBC_00365]